MSQTETQKSTCVFCHLPKANAECGACQNAICKPCAEKLPGDSFEFLSVKPALLNHSLYCPNCYDTHVVPALAQYSEMLEQAKKVGIWAKKYRGIIPIIKRSREPISVENVTDHDLAILKLAFRATELGFDGLVQTTVASKKVRDHGYQKMLWSAQGTPALIDRARLDRTEWHEYLFDNNMHV